MRKIVAVVAAAAVPLVSASAVAQEASPVAIRGVQGAVYVISDGSVTQARPGEGLAPGDRVFALSGGSAELGSPDGCRLALPSGDSATINANASCSGRLQEGRAGYIAADYAVQSGGATGDSGATSQPPAAVPNTSGTIFGMSATSVAIGGVAAAGIVAGLAVGLSSGSGHKDQPVSS